MSVQASVYFQSQMTDELQTGLEIFYRIVCFTSQPPLRYLLQRSQPKKYNRVHRHIPEPLTKAHSWTHPERGGFFYLLQICFLACHIVRYLLKQTNHKEIQMTIEKTKNSCSSLEEVLQDTQVRAELETLVVHLMQPNGEHLDSVEDWECRLGDRIHFLVNGS